MPTYTFGNAGRLTLPAAVAIPAIIGAAGSIGGALIGSKASKNAAGQIVDAQGRVIQNTTDAVNQARSGVADATTAGQAGVTAGISGANDVLTEAQQKQLGYYSPYTQAGQNSVASLQQLAAVGGGLDNKFSFGQSDLQNDPGYKFTLAEGQKAIQRSAAAQGGLFSGGTLKSLAGYTTGLADTTFNGAFNRAKTTFDTNRQSALDRVGTLQGLAGMGLQGAAGSSGVVGDTAARQSQNIFGGSQVIAGLGQQGAAQQGQFGLQGSGQINQALTGQGNAQAAGTVGSANAWTSAIGGGSKAIQDFLAQRKLSSNAAVRV